ncbi:MAG: SRPBCC family protein [Janibacter sp.]
MSEFVVRVETHLGPQAAWSRVWDLDRHTAVIPLTTVALDPPAVALAAGVGFTGRTALGPFGFDDTMHVDRWVPPTADAGGVAVVVKTSRLVGGRIEMAVASTRDTPFARGSAIRWRQSVHLPWLPAPLRWLESLAVRAAAPGYRMVLRRLLA